MNSYASPQTDYLVAAARRSARDRLATILLAVGRKWSSDKSHLFSPSARAIVFAPHPDDEVLGCGGTIALKVMAGADIQVVVMTDGRASHAKLVDAPTLIRMRRTEAIEAAKRLGLEPADYSFLDFEDQRLHEYARQAQQRVVEILQRFEPEQVFVPHRQDRLSDHVATFEIVASALRAHNKPAKLLEYPVWLWNTWPWTASWPRVGSILSRAPGLLRDGAELAFGCSTRIDIRPVLQRKRDALAQYRSQVQRRRNDPQWPILSDVSGGSFLDRFLTGVEVFRQTEVSRLSPLPAH
jgi:LmbE family N-acetylglucosaminyl deacetylase